MNDKDIQATRKRLPGMVTGMVSAAALLALGVQARGQEGTLASFSLSFNGSYTDNDPDEDESDFTTGLSFDLSSVTRTQSFSISADGRLALQGGRLDFERPGLAVDYSRENRSTAFDVGLSYSTRDVEGALDVIDPVTLELIDLIDDDGTLEALGIKAGLVTGRDARFGTDTQFSYTDRTYSGTSDPDLNDLTSWRIGTTLRFDVDPRITLRSDASYRVTQEDDLLQTETRTTSFGIGGDILIDQLWSASVELSHSLTETEEDGPGGRVVTEEDGAEYTLSLTRQFRDGTLGLSLARDVSDIGTEDSLSLFRSRELANGSELGWSLGFVSFPN
ncbi:hypothetical protein P6F26_14250, partial [Roseibacterium sp. SDUM158017]|uniref:hypothetical protein n=1 Tax=Roseicyclus salinarum TaxID=3036773 RepID=UPI00241503BF